MFGLIVKKNRKILTCVFEAQINESNVADCIWSDDDIRCGCFWLLVSLERRGVCTCRHSDVQVRKNLEKRLW